MVEHIREREEEIAMIEQVREDSTFQLVNCADSFFMWTVNLFVVFARPLQINQDQDQSNTANLTDGGSGIDTISHPPPSKSRSLLMTWRLIHLVIIASIVMGNFLLNAAIDWSFDRSTSSNMIIVFSDLLIGLPMLLTLPFCVFMLRSPRLHNFLDFIAKTFFAQSARPFLNQVPIPRFARKMRKYFRIFTLVFWIVVLVTTIVHIVSMMWMHSFLRQFPISKNQVDWWLLVRQLNFLVMFPIASCIQLLFFGLYVFWVMLIVMGLDMLRCKLQDKQISPSQFPYLHVQLTAKAESLFQLLQPMLIIQFLVSLTNSVLFLYLVYAAHEDNSVRVTAAYVYSFVWDTIFMFVILVPAAFVTFKGEDITLDVGKLRGLYGHGARTFAGLPRDESGELLFRSVPSFSSYHHPEPFFERGPISDVSERSACEPWDSVLIYLLSHQFEFQLAGICISPGLVSGFFLSFWGVVYFFVRPYLPNDLR